LRLLGSKNLDSLSTVLGHLHLESGTAKQTLQQQPVLPLIFQDQNAVLGLSGLQADDLLAVTWGAHHLRFLNPFNGHSMRNNVPLPGALSGRIVPPIICTNCRVMLSPKPVPFWLPGLPTWTKGAKMRAHRCG